MREARKKSIILAIETSCDDTCASVISNGTEILSNIVSSQSSIHAKYGGIVPEIASRKHVEVIDIIIEEAVTGSGLAFEDMDAVAVTNRPGLLGSLVVGASAAKALSYYHKIPVIAINHLKGHAFSSILAFPELADDGKDKIALIVSGGHTSLYLLKKDLSMENLGHTLDDAIGEAYDKIARFLGLGYPGGPIIDSLSKKANGMSPRLPEPMSESKDLNFSFSGLKTALIYATKKDRDLLKGEKLYNLLASFQRSAVNVVIEKTIKAAVLLGIDKIIVSGGVAANSYLRQGFLKKAKETGIEIFIPPVYLCMDNAAMVGCLGHYEYLQNNFSEIDFDVYSKSEI